MVNTRKVLVAFCEVTPQIFKQLSSVKFAIDAKDKVFVETAGLDEFRISKLKRLLTLPDNEFQKIIDSELSIFIKSDVK